MIYSKKVILITGASRGLGLELAKYFLALDATVINFSRSSSNYQHKNFKEITVDISDKKSIKNGFSKLKKDFNSIDMLINNAAVLDSKHCLLLTDESIFEMISINYIGGVLISREVAKIMAKKKFGRIIAITSMATYFKPAGDSIYASSKSALVAFHEVMARELSEFGITCNSIQITAINGGMFEMLPKDRVMRLIERNPIPDICNLDDVCNIVDFLFNSRSRQITAQTISLGGIN